MIPTAKNQALERAHAHKQQTEAKGEHAHQHRNGGDRANDLAHLHLQGAGAAIRGSGEVGHMAKFRFPTGGINHRFAMATRHGGARKYQIGPLPHRHQLAIANRLRGEGLPMASYR